MHLLANYYIGILSEYRVNIAANAMKDFYKMIVIISAYTGESYKNA